MEIIDIKPEPIPAKDKPKTQTKKKASKKSRSKAKDKPTKAENSSNVIVKIDESGNYVFNSQLDLGRAALLCMQKAIAPPDLIAKGQTAVAAALVMCKQFNLPQQAMNEMAFVNGRIQVHSKLYTALAQRHPLYGEDEIFEITEKQERRCVDNKNLHEPTWGVVIRVRKKGSNFLNEYVFTMDDAERAGLLDPRKRDGSKNNDSAWLKYTRDMLYHKCKFRAYGREYASSLEGIEMFEDRYEPTTRDVTPKPEETSQGLSALKDRLG